MSPNNQSKPVSHYDDFCEEIFVPAEYESDDEWTASAHSCLLSTGSRWRTWCH